MVRVPVAASYLTLFLTATTAFAAGPASETPTETVSLQASAAALIGAAARTAAAPEAAPVMAERWVPIRRPSVLPSLYIGSALLQAFDAYSTLSAVKAGGVEVNPVMKSAASNPVALIGIKATVTAASILTAERMWRSHNRVGAIAVMAASNGLMAIVAAHNASVLSALH